ncbi:unnamed protein product [Paramecium sonneborni]|uniref:Uncharacterized protein n=1 Tax=Paramecium sonneborni TaxID=65129 RepID=A0A8S1NDT8_9CILI|nr:unnamed protein product [Paramecium sonneborni]
MEYRQVIQTLFSLLKINYSTQILQLFIKIIIQWEIENQQFDKNKDFIISQLAVLHLLMQIQYKISITQKILKDCEHSYIIHIALMKIKLQHLSNILMIIFNLKTHKTMHPAVKFLKYILRGNDNKRYPGFKGQFRLVTFSTQSSILIPLKSNQIIKDPIQRQNMEMTQYKENFDGMIKNNHKNIRSDDGKKKRGMDLVLMLSLTYSEQQSKTHQKINSQEIEHFQDGLNLVTCIYQLIHKLI